MAKIKTVHELFSYVKKEHFMNDYAERNPKDGFNHKFTGSRGQTLKKRDYEDIVKGLDGFILDLTQLRKEIKRENKIK